MGAAERFRKVVHRLFDLGRAERVGEVDGEREKDVARAGAASALLQQFDALIGQLPP